jgi:hypothetical protein
MAESKSTPQERAPLPPGEVERLVQAVKHQHALDCSGWSTTPVRKELESFADRLEEMAKALADSIILLRVRPIHERPYIGADGLPIQGEPRSILQMRGDLSALAESTRRAIDELPDPRRKIALPLAVQGFLHLSYDAGRLPPSSYEKGPDVQEIAQICESAGLQLAHATIKNELNAQLKSFDGYWPSDLPRIFG